MSGGLLGAGRFNSSSKWSLHLPIWSSSLVRITSFLSFIGLSACLNFPASFLVVSYSCFMFPRAAASSASFARLSIKFTLSVFTLFFTALFATVYCSWATPFVDRVLLLFRTAFLSFLTCYLLIVSTEIQSLCCLFFFPSTSSHVLVHVFFRHSQCGFTSMFSSSSSSCNVSYLLLSVSLNVSILSLSFGNSTLYLVLFFRFSTLLFSFNFSFISTRWWSTLDMKHCLRSPDGSMDIWANCRSQLRVRAAGDFWLKWPPKTWHLFALSVIAGKDNKWMTVRVGVRQVSADRR